MTSATRTFDLGRHEAYAIGHGLGMALLAVCAAVALAGIDVMHFWTALILLGLGWNFGFIGATTMLTETYRPEEKAKVQGLNDLLVFGFVAAASFSSGKLFVTIGWANLNLFAFPIVLVCVAGLAASLLGRRTRVAWPAGSSGRACGLTPVSRQYIPSPDPTGRGGDGRGFFM